MIVGSEFAGGWLPIFAQLRCSWGWVATNCRPFRPQYQRSSKRSDAGRSRNAAIWLPRHLPSQAQPKFENLFQEKFNERLG